MSAVWSSFLKRYGVAGRLLCSVDIKDCCTCPGFTTACMAESSQNEENRDSNPITDNKILLGVPRKLSNGCHGNNKPPLVGEPHLMNGDGGSHGNNINVPDDNGGINESSLSSSSDDDEEEEGEGSTESSSEEEGELSEEAQLKRAGVDIDLQALGTATEGGVAPLPLMSEVSGQSQYP